MQASTVVGYNNLDLASGKQRIYTLAFENTTGGAIDLQSIVPYDDDEISDGGFSIWWYNPNKNEKGNIIGNEYAIWSEYWYDPLDPNADEDGFCYAEDLSEYVWTHDDGKVDPMTGENFLPSKWEKAFRVGDGFYLKSTVTTPKLTASGAVLNPGVSSAYYPVTLKDGQQLMIANPFPVALDLTTLVPFDDDEISDGGFSI